MIRLATQVFATAALLLSLVWLLPTTFEFAFEPLDVVQVMSSKPPTDELVDFAENEVPRLAQSSHYKNTLRHPIFFEDRRIPVPAPRKPAVKSVPPKVDVARRPPPNAEKLRLLGIAVDNSSKQALISSPSEQGQWVNEGMRVEGWTLERIDNDRVLLTFGGHEVELRLYPPIEPN